MILTIIIILWKNLRLDPHKSYILWGLLMILTIKRSLVRIKTKSSLKSSLKHNILVVWSISNSILVNLAAASGSSFSTSGQRVFPGIVLCLFGVEFVSVKVKFLIRFIGWELEAPCFGIATPKSSSLYYCSSIASKFLLHAS